MGCHREGRAVVAIRNRLSATAENYEVRTTHLAVLALLWSSSAGLQAAPDESAWAVSHLAVGSVAITVRIDPSLPQPRAMLEDWIKDNAQNLVAYYGRFPVPTVAINVGRRRGEPVNSGVEYDGRRIDIQLDPRATPTDLADDWRLTH